MTGGGREGGREDGREGGRKREVVGDGGEEEEQVGEENPNKNIECEILDT